MPDTFRGVFREDLPARAAYCEAAGIGQVIPRAVAVPVDADDVQSLVLWAARERVPLIPRGSGSSMSGGAIGDGVIVDLSGLRWMDAPDAHSQTIRCGPGVLRDDVDAAARKVGLTFPVDPSSSAFCTVGGMAATNAAGAHTLRYGAMRAWVECLDCVLSDGSRAVIRRNGPVLPNEPLYRFQLIAPELLEAEASAPSVHHGVRKESSGYGLHAFAESGSMVDLIVGSEGSLALIVGLELRLTPIKPFTASVLGAFPTLDAAVAAAGSARAAGVSTCELLDRTFLDVARSGGVNVPAPAETEAILLAEVEADSRAGSDRLARAIEAEFRQAGATDVSLALDPSTEHAMWELRHAASPVLGKLDPALKSMQFIEDGCVPPERLAEYVTGVRAALDRLGIRGVIFGHAGDAHMHVNPLVDVRKPDWRERVHALLDEVTGLVARLGGTVSGEHGDGRVRAPLLPRVWPAATLARFAAIKHALDPLGIFNPGVKLVLAGDAPPASVKYDPELPPLPAQARAVLERVERERAYARSRLDLLAEVSAPL